LKSICKNFLYMNLTVEDKLRDFKERCLKRGYPSPDTRFKIDFLKYYSELPSLTVRELRELHHSPVKDENLFRITILVGRVLMSRDSVRGFQIPAAVDEMIGLISQRYYPAKVA
jgi:hypothetical protein